MPLQPYFAHHGFNALLDWIRDRQLPYLFERSLRLEPNTVESRRALFSIPTAALGPTAAEEVLHICRCMSSPISHQSAIARYLKGAGHVHFGFEASHGLAIGKCYLELPGGEVDAGRLKFLGFKWSMSDSSIAVVSRYRFCDISGRQQLLDRLLQNAAEDWRPLAADLLLPFIPEQITVEQLQQLQLLEVLEEGSDRHSFDLNVYERSLPVSAVADLIAACCKAWNGPADEFEAWLCQHQTATIGHLAFGETRSNRPFLTVYHSADLTSLPSVSINES